MKTVYAPNTADAYFADAAIWVGGNPADAMIIATVLLLALCLRLKNWM